MHHFRLQFAYPWAPWLFFLLVPALAVMLFLYFRQNKRYRRTRNRVISMVLHMLVMTLSVTVLTGLVFVYDVVNLNNEVLLLVDLSDTEQGAEEVRDAFLGDVIRDCGYDGFKVGIVTFGFTQEYAVPFTYDTDKVLETYHAAPLPDTTATDIAAALTFSRGLFENPETSKIVLITDGMETDEDANTVIRSIAAQGTKVDCVRLPSALEGDTARVTGMTFPDYHLEVGDPCRIAVSVTSDRAQNATVDLYDNGEKVATSGVQSLAVGTQAVYFDVTFEEGGLHEMSARISAPEDGFDANDNFTSYYYIEVFNKVLVLEEFEGNSEELEALLREDGADYEVTKLNFETDSDKIPKSLDALRAYDQVILNNVAQADLPAGFEDLLFEYVYDCGGGLFTLGGREEDGLVAHAYNRQDLLGTRLQQMLPVQAIDYTPPVGVIIIIDISSSMDNEFGGLTKRKWATEGAYECLGALTDRDYCGIMTLDTNYAKILSPTPCTQLDVIRDAIYEVADLDGGMTQYADAIDSAGQELVTLKNVDRRHVILITDSQPTEPEDRYLPLIKQYYERNAITFSTVGIGVTDSDPASNKIKRIAEEGHGRAHFYDLSNRDKLLTDMIGDVQAEHIEELQEGDFSPGVSDALSPLLRGVELSDGKLGGTLGGFYGVRVRSSAELVLVGEYDVPIYAQWKFGAGKVGSFMSDLHGKWAEGFLADGGAKRFLLNAVNGLMPVSNIRPKSISATLTEGNYINRLSIFSDLKEGESIRAVLTPVSGEGEDISLNATGDATSNVYVLSALGSENGFSRATFIIKEAGVYRIRIEKVDAAGNADENETVTLYRSFAYSKEYDAEEGDADLAKKLAALAESGGGTLIGDLSDPYEIFENFDIYLTRKFDPTVLFISLAMALFLLDIVVRKFRFKWPHEIVRERRARKEAENKEEK